MARRRSLPVVVAEGDLRGSLVALRDKLAEELEVTSGRDVAPLARQLSLVLARLETLADRGEVSKLDRLAASVDELAPRRRAGRISDAKSS